MELIVRKVSHLAETSVYLGRVQEIQKNVLEACQRSGRNPEDIRVIGVTKTVNDSALGPLLDAGLREFGENRWQHARELLASPRSSEATWHFIGHLQSNKAKYVIPRFSWCHSVDSVGLAQEISRCATLVDKIVQCLIQVNVAGEETKSGVAPKRALAMLEEIYSLPGLRVRGFMTMAPKANEPEASRPVFQELRSLLLNAQDKMGDEQLRELSMGMSDDYGIAVEEGATIVRIGRRLTDDLGHVHFTG